MSPSILPSLTRKTFWVVEAQPAHTGLLLPIERARECAFSNECARAHARGLKEASGRRAINEWTLQPKNLATLENLSSPPSFAVQSLSPAKMGFENFLTLHCTHPRDIKIRRTIIIRHGLYAKLETYYWSVLSSLHNRKW